MGSFKTEPIVLSNNQFAILAESLRRMDRAYLERRNAAFTKMDKDITIIRNGQDMEVDIPDLDLSFIK